MNHILFYFNLYQDSRYKDFAADLHSRWQDLGRKIKSDVQANQEKYSLVFLDNPFVVPGGRFREMYYWDSYWTIQGLIVSEMYDTVKGTSSVGAKRTKQVPRHDTNLFTFSNYRNAQ